MTKNRLQSDDLLLFDEFMPIADMNAPNKFVSECPPDKKVKVEDLFKFRRGRADMSVSLVICAIALMFLFFFWSQTGWEGRKLPDDLTSYLLHQLGLYDMEGRVTRFGRILKQSWFAPMLCLAILVPTALWNGYASFKVYQWRKRFLLPTSAEFEFSKYLAALEFVAYFILYTLITPIFGYLIATLTLGTFLTWRLGYRSRLWMIRGFSVSLIIVFIFRSFLQIKTPNSVWLYDQLPQALRGFMLTYF